MVRVTKFVTVIIVIAAFGVTGSDGWRVSAEECERRPKEVHCVIEWSSRFRLPHTKRYFYDWSTRRCILIRWSTHVHCPLRDDTNNFSTHDECLWECGGWA